MPPLPMNTSAPATEMAMRLKWASPARAISITTTDQRDQFDGGFISLRGLSLRVEVRRPVDDPPLDADLGVHQVLLQRRHVHRHPQPGRVRDADETVLAALDVVGGQVGRQALRLDRVFGDDVALDAGERL